MAFGSRLLFPLTLHRIWVYLVTVLVSRLRPIGPRNGLSEIIENWEGPQSVVGTLYSWPDNFSRDINPIPCHSHNDYWRRVPLFDALYAGCISVEADIWLDGTAEDILVGHTVVSLRSDWTLQTLYLHPLMIILAKQNMQSQTDTNRPLYNSAIGVFDSSPDTSLILLLDMKSNGAAMWSLLQQQLEHFRQKDWLSYWDCRNRRFVSRPLTVVVTGNAPFEMVEANSTHRDIFYDAPLDDIQNPRYTVENSYYASTSMQASVGWPPAGRFTPRQIKSIKKQISIATEKRLKARYWNTPNWPISVRNSVWSFLIRSGVGVLNVDDLFEVSHWNWDWCIVAGLILCGWP